MSDSNEQLSRSSSNGKGKPTLKRCGICKMIPLKPMRPFKEEIRMAHKKKQKRRSYGTGCVIERGKGLAIRWREKVLQADGTIKEVMRCKALGLVSKTEANKVLQEFLDSSIIP